MEFIFINGGISSETESLLSLDLSGIYWHRISIEPPSCTETLTTDYRYFCGNLSLKKICFTPFSTQQNRAVVPNKRTKMFNGTGENILISEGTAKFPSKRQLWLPIPITPYQSAKLPMVILCPSNPPFEGAHDAYSAVNLNLYLIKI